MHHSRLCAPLIDCRTPDIDRAAEFWAAALGRAVDREHPGTRGNYRMLETPPDEPIVQIQRVEHESRVHVDIETDDIPAEVSRLEALGAEVVNRRERWVVMQAPTGHRFCVVRVQRPGFSRNVERWRVQKQRAKPRGLTLGLYWCRKWDSNPHAFKGGGF
jgi:catechol 2,3-dioxygenase-like lactoylglutathione lyase family enzyme